MAREDDFKRLFGEIEDYLNKLVRTETHVSFPILVDMAGRKHSLVRNNARDLKNLADLRNLLSHGSKPIATPTDEAIRKLKFLCQNLVSHPTALDMATRSVFTCDLKDKIRDVIHEMKTRVYTHVPVYKTNEFFGVLSESTVTYWLATQADDSGEGFISTENAISAMEEFLTNDQNNEYLFMDKRKSAFEVEGKFFEYIEHGKRLGAVFVTETGKKSEKLLGIITAWDLPRIAKYKGSGF
jgi:CBS domain-containing protein